MGRRIIDEGERKHTLKETTYGVNKYGGDVGLFLKLGLPSKVCTVFGFQTVNHEENISIRTNKRNEGTYSVE